MYDSPLLPLLVGTILFGVLVFFILLFVMQYRRAQSHFELERQQMRQALLETEIEIQEQTLENVSRELHDNYGQVASLIGMNLKMLSPPSTEKDMERLADIKGMMTQLVSDIRSLSTSLNSNKIAQIGLIEGVEQDIQRIHNMEQLRIKLDADAYQNNLSDDQVKIVYRMFQELINNMLKHSKASEVMVKFSTKGNYMHFEFSDNGVGMDLSTIKEGNGLTNLTKRSKMLNANYKVISEPGNGSTFNFRIPLTNKS